MKKLFSLKELINQSQTTLSRFPLTFLSALLASVLAIFLIEQEIEDPWWIQINIILTLGLPLFTALHVWSENLDLSKLKKQIILFVGIGWMGLLVLEIPLIKMFPQSFALNFIGFAVLFHLLAAFLPFYKSNSVQAFWQFNKSMFLRFLLSALYSAVLYAGLSLALLAIQFLLEVEMHEKIWVDLLLLIALPFNTIFFLGGLPQNVLDLEDDLSFPNGLKKFVQFVLMPLVVIYLLILYIYSAKISFLTELPEGFVTYLILAFAVAGMLALLLVSPLRSDDKTPWVKWYTNVYYWALWPLIALLFTAISTRLLEYGWTENRVIIFGLAVWLFGITAYFTFLKRSNIMAIPISLFVLVAVLLLGPLSAENVAKRSQRNRLESLLSSQKWIDEKGEILEDKIRNSTNDSIKYDVKETIKYLAKHFGNDGLEGFLPADSFLAPMNEENEANSFINILEEDWKLPYSNPRNRDPNEDLPSKTIYVNYSNEKEDEISLFGAKKAFLFSPESNGKYEIIDQNLVCKENGKKTIFKLNPFFNKLPKDLSGDDYQDVTLKNNTFVIDAEVNGKKLKIILRNFSIDYDRKSGKVLGFFVGNYGEGYGEIPGFVLEY